jgi:polyisoprenoid-binding protein YceI
MKRSLLGVALAALTFLSPAVAADTYEIDAAHSGVMFTVKHMVVFDVTGKFTQFIATGAYDPADPSSLSFEATIQAESVDTANSKRDNHLRSADFFEVEKHPTLTFKSKQADKTDDTSWKVTGDLTIRGVTREAVLDVSFLAPEIKDMAGNYRVPVRAAGKINRKDFGLTWNRALETGGVLVGEEVDIRIDAAMVRQRS